MKTKNISIGIPIFLCLLLPLSPTQAETSPSIILSEIQIAGKESNDEFIELYNPSLAMISLGGLKLCRKTSSGSFSQIKSFSSTDIINSKSFFLFAHSDSIFANTAGFTVDAKTSSSALATNNSLAVTDSCSNDKSPTLIIDSVAWDSGKNFNDDTYRENGAIPASKSLVRNISSLAWSLSDQPSPTNSRGEIYQSTPPIVTESVTPPSPITTPQNTSIRINEIFPNPAAKQDAGEFIELYNFGTTEADVSGWVIRDATKTGKYTFPANTIMAAATYLVITDQSFKLSLNNTNETLSLFNNLDVLIDSVYYKKSEEDVSLNYTAAGWRGGVLTPGAVNQPNILPETKEKVPKKGYRGVTINFDAQGKDANNDSLKYTWDFGDGHKGYKEETSHAYEKNGNYTVTLKTTDGKDDVIETFTITINSFPQPEIRITSLLANPAGNDTENEWMMLENRDKKMVNLKGYSIATGWKSLANHPIREDFFIKPKSEARLTRTFSLFALPNQKGKIELRAPDGKVLQKIQYKLEKSIGEDTIYQKKKGQKWAFEESLAQNASSSITHAITEIPPLTPLINNSTEKIPTPEPEENTEKEKELEILPAPISLNPDRPDLRDILAYGTHVNIPDSITLHPLSTEGIPLLDPSPHFTSSLVSTVFSDINASLNEFLTRD